MIDTHAHLFVEEFSEDLPSVIERAKLAGVERVYMPNIDDSTVEDMLAVCQQYAGFCYPMIGFHPTSVDATSKEKVLRMKSLLQEGHPYVGIGEVGLDLYWDKTYLREQQEIFDEQIGWALEWNLPLIIHCREAFPELLEVMRFYRNTNLTGIFHCFTGTVQEVEPLLEFEQFMIGINGVVTFKKSTLPEALKKVPLERIVLETDAPYLAPVPHRGKRNETAYVADVLNKVAELYQMNVNEVETITTRNALKVFKNTDEVFKVY